MLEHRRARHFLEEAGANDAAQRPARVIRAEREQEGGVGLVLFQKASEEISLPLFEPAP